MHTTCSLQQNAAITNTMLRYNPFAPSRFYEGGFPLSFSFTDLFGRNIFSFEFFKPQKQIEEEPEIQKKREEILQNYIKSIEAEIIPPTSLPKKTKNILNALRKNHAIDTRFYNLIGMTRYIESNPTHSETEITQSLFNKFFNSNAANQFFSIKNITYFFPNFEILNQKEGNLNHLQDLFSLSTFYLEEYSYEKLFELFGTFHNGFTREELIKIHDALDSKKIGITEFKILIGLVVQKKDPALTRQYLSRFETQAHHE